MATIFKEKSWWQFTLTRITLSLIVGVLLGKYVFIPKWLLLFILSGSIIVWVMVDQLSMIAYFKKRWISGLSILVVFIGVGIRVYQLATKTTIQIKARVILQGIPIKKPNSYQATAAMGETLLLIYFHPSTNIHLLNAGTIIHLHKKPLPIANTSNPGGFNFKEYAASQKIHHQIYLTSKDFSIVGETNLSFSISLLSKAQQYVLKTLEKYIHNPRERSVSEALLIGYKKNLDKELMNAYSNTGVIHIIAISGLHLGMIYALLRWLFKPMNRLKKMQWLKSSAILFIIWGFTLLTGAGASVLRAAVMFSFLLLGAHQNRPNHIINTLAASAFCLLLYQPLFLWDIGFQLSYAAVIGIVVFAKPIEKWIYIENKILRYCWQLSSVTFAAQLLTSPLLLYYFNSFPNLFLFTNFIAVPISGCILYLLIGLLLIAPFSFIAIPIGTLIEWLILQMNSFIQNSATLPFAINEYIQVSLAQTICLYIFIIAWAVWIAQKNRVSFWLGCSGVLFFIAIRSIDLIQLQNQQKLIVYHAPKYTAIDILERLGHRYLGDRALERNNILKNNYLSPTRTLYRVGLPLQQTTMMLRAPFVISRNKKVLLVHPRLAFPELYMIPEIDLIIFLGGPSIPFTKIASRFPKTILVFDSSNPLWKIQLWKKEADRLHLRHHSVPEQGAFEYNL
ncbi:ComEC/Rec2 family competence protein [Sediminibacterium sp.]|uniref:ComEC/Rec2 family competence protein n=1 Tax=Sediminibacterium sp. TaxID=1917865 RepID=UPI0025EB8FE9|nr:ComEC/Rec2 family competence protein [Sediminibacterium sp.]MBT9485406.1 ComEC/Rec2 family competence protein [Sediminibacterium sp.]